MTALYSIVDADNYAASTAAFDERQVKLVEGALNYHSLVTPGRELVYRVYLSVDEEYPRLTDVTTLTGEWADPSTFQGEFTARSLVRGKCHPDDAFDDRDRCYVKDEGVRYLRISPTVSNDAKAREAEVLRPEQKLYNYLEREHTLTLDRIRESRIRKNERYLQKRMVRARGQSFFGTPEERAQFRFRLVRPAAPQPDAPRAILFGLHWLQTGGAERWAFETIQIAKDQGFLPIVLTDQLSHHYWITRPELEGAILVPMTMPIQRWYGDEPLLRSLTESFDIKAVVIHHCAWLYSRLPWFRKYLPQVPVVDCLHIIEYKGGGYPGTGVVFDDYIDLHHVISPQLVTWMTEVQGVKPSKVVLAPLAGLTTSSQSDFKPRANPGRFTVTFIGRLARQKRPDIFLLVADKLHERFPDIDFILQGNGEMEPLVDRQLEERGLSGVVQRRGEEVPVPQTLAESDLLLLTSTNEGLALTVFEAVAAGVPVVSTRVGSQDTLVPEDALVERSAASLLRQIVPLIGMLKDNEEARLDLWQREQAAVERFAELPSATEWATDWMKGLNN